MISPLMKTFSRPENSGLKPGAQFQQRGHAPAGHHPAGGRLEDAADHLEQRAFAAAVRPHQTDHLAALHAERDVPQRPEIGVERFVPQGIQFADPVEGRLIQPIDLRNVLDKQQTTYHKAMRLRYALVVALLALSLLSAAPHLGDANTRSMAIGSCMFILTIRMLSRRGWNIAEGFYTREPA